MIKKSLQVFLTGNSEPRGDGTFAGCKQTFNFPETVYKAKRIVLCEVLVRGAAQQGQVASHLVLELSHPSLHTPILCNQSALTDKHVIIADPMTVHKNQSAGINEICHPYYNRELFWINPGNNINSLPIHVYSPENFRIDTAILRFDIHHEIANYRDVSYEKNPSNSFNDQFH